MARLTGKVAVITGGSSGIGLATAKKFVEEGAYVFITGRRESELAKAKAKIGKNVTTVQGDVAKIEDLDRLYQTVKAEQGKVDIVMANAGFVEFGTLASSSVEHYDKTFGINARGTFFTVQKALPLLRDGASIILVSSGVHTKGIPHYNVYSATKAAIRSFARSWAAELKDRNIRVNTLSPGATDTPIIDGQFKTKAEAEEVKKQFAAIIPLGRLGDATELANAALFLASSDSSYVTGASKGIGAGIALAMAREGAAVAVNYSSSEPRVRGAKTVAKMAGVYGIGTYVFSRPYRYHNNFEACLCGSYRFESLGRTRGSNRRVRA